VSAGGLKLAWLTQEASMADCASPLFAVTAHSDPTIRALHSSTFQLNLSQFGHTSRFPPIY
jgi:hypothetical protein